jgi:hypothetical protein
MIKIKDHLGNEFKSKKEMCKHYNINVGTFNHRISKGCSLEEALTNNNNYQRYVVDHLGNEFRSKKEMCKHYGIGYGVFSQRIDKGWELERALTTGTTGTSGQEYCIDHLGNKWKTKKEMIKHYGINCKTYYCRIEKGWTLKDALTIKAGEKLGAMKRCKDHLGNEFKSVDEMCRYYSISYRAFRGRIDKGWSLEKALTAEVNSRGPSRIVDYLGNEYSSRAEMCMAYNILPDTFAARIKKGWSVEDALTKPVIHRFKKDKKWIDHKGREFNSFSEMCYYNGTTVTRVRVRLRQGQTMEQALSAYKVQDHTGKEFGNIRQMAEYYGLSSDVLYYRLHKGWDLERALTENIHSEHSYPYKVLR